MDMPYDEAVMQGPHCFTENITADGLDNVLDKFRTIAFYTAPFLIATDALVGRRLFAEVVHTYPRFNI